jgi:hypothetical protein
MLAMRKPVRSPTPIDQPREQSLPVAEESGHVGTLTGKGVTGHAPLWTPRFRIHE